MSRASVGSVINACGCCRADGDRRGARSPERARPARRTGRPATAGTRGAGPRRAGGRAMLQRECCANAPPGSALRTVGLRVYLHVVGRRRRPAVTLDEQRPGQRFGQHRRRDAADLQPGRHVRQQLVLGRRTVGASVRAPRPRRPPRVRSPAAGSASGAAACPRWCRGAAATTRAAMPRSRVSRGRRPRRLTPARRRPSPRRRVAADRCMALLAWLIAPSPSPRASTAAARRTRPGSAPTIRRVPPRPAARRRSRVPPCRGRAARRPTPRARSTPTSPTG